MRRRVLFVVYGGGHANMVGPVAQALDSKAGASLEMVALGLPAAGPTLRRDGLPVIALERYAADDAQTLGEALLADQLDERADVRLRDDAAYLGLCYLDLVLRMGAMRAAERYATARRHAFFPLTLMRRVLDDLRPDCVVTSNSPCAEAAAVAAAAERRVPTLLMNDLFTGEPGYPLRADAITFLNAASRSMFVEDGLVDADHAALHDTGNPAFDALLSDGLTTADRSRDASRRPRILFADVPADLRLARRPAGESFRRSLLAELDALGATADALGADLLLRPHPAQDRAAYREWSADRPCARLVDGEPLRALLGSVDLVVGGATTVLLEAIYLGAQALQLEPRRYRELPLAALGLAWGVEDLADLPVIAARALTEEAGRRDCAARARLALPQRPAGPRIADIVLEMLARTGSHGSARTV